MLLDNAACCHTQEFDESERKQTARGNGLEHIVQIGKQNGKPHFLAVDLGEQHKAFIDDLLHVLGELTEFGIRHGHMAPIFGPGIIVDVLDEPGFFLESAHIQLPDGQIRETPPQETDASVHSLLVVESRVGVIGPHGHLTFKAIIQKESLVPRVIVGHQDGRLLVEPIHQKSSHIVHGRIGRTAHGAQSLPHEPFSSGVQQGLGDSGIFNRIEKAEEAHAVVVFLEMHSVSNTRDTTDHHAVLVPRQKELHVTVFEEGILLRIDQLCDIYTKGRYPDFGVSEQIEGKLDERPTIASRSHGTNFNRLDRRGKGRRARTGLR